MKERKRLCLFQPFGKVKVAFNVVAFNCANLHLYIEELGHVVTGGAYTLEMYVKTDKVGHEVRRVRKLEHVLNPCLSLLAFQLLKN